jgi:sulfur carrier protein
MEIYVNGEPRQVEDSLHISELVDMLDLSNRRIAVEVNLEIVPRSSYTTYQLCAGDKIEIVHAIGGGSIDGG